MCSSAAELLQTGQKEMPDLRATRPALVMEVGCGSGCLTAYLAKNLRGPAYIATVRVVPSQRSSDILQRAARTYPVRAAVGCALPSNEAPTVYNSNHLAGIGCW